MALSSCFSHPSHFSFKIDSSKYAAKSSQSIRMDLRLGLFIKSINTEMRTELSFEQCFLGRSRAIFGPNLGRFAPSRNNFCVKASWLSNPQIASSVFTLGTAAVLPFYTLMVVAPKAELQMQTKKSMESSIPYVVLGLLYAYLLHLSWTPDTLQLMFASKYWLPELSGMAKMFSNEMTLSSAWIHLLAIDLFAARFVGFQAGRFITTDWRTRLKPGIPFLFACYFARSGLLVMSSPKHLPKLQRNPNLRLEFIDYFFFLFKIQTAFM